MPHYANILDTPSHKPLLRAQHTAMCVYCCNDKVISVVAKLNCKQLSLSVSVSLSVSKCTDTQTNIVQPILVQPATANQTKPSNGARPQSGDGYFWHCCWAPARPVCLACACEWNTRESAVGVMVWHQQRWRWAFALYAHIVCQPACCVECVCLCAVCQHTKKYSEWRTSQFAGGIDLCY